MTDTQFTTVVDDIEELLNVVDIDGVGDVETLLMFLFARPIGVEEVWNEDRDETSLEVVVQGNDEAIGCTLEFPLSIVDLVRSCAQTVDDFEPFRADDSQTEAAPNFRALADDELNTVLQGALGKVRLFNMMDEGESE